MKRPLPGVDDPETSVSSGAAAAVRADVPAVRILLSGQVRFPVVLLEMQRWQSATVAASTNASGDGIASGAGRLRQHDEPGPPLGAEVRAPPPERTTSAEATSWRPGAGIASGHGRPPELAAGS